MKFKNCLLCLLVLIIVVFCSGCATIQHTRKVVDGQVQDIIQIKLEKDQFTSNEEFSKVANEIDLDFRAYNKSINNWFNQFLPSGENGEVELYENVKNNITVQYIGNVSAGEYYFELTFASSGYFYLFYGVDIDGVEENVAYDSIMKDIGPFLIEYENLKVDDFSAFSYKYSRTASDSIYNSILNQVIIGGNTTYFEKYSGFVSGEDPKQELLENVKILQVFGTVDDRICSNANDGVEKGSDGFYYHYWDLNQMVNLDENSKIEIFLRSANQSTWYILALVISTVAIIIAFVIAKKVNLNEIDKALTLDYKNDDEE